MHAYYWVKNHKSCRFMTYIDPLEYNEKNMLHLLPIVDTTFSFNLFWNEQRASFIQKKKRDTWFLAAALCFACELLICLLWIEIRGGSARAVTVRSWHPGTQPEWILQSSKSACQEMGHKGNNCQLNQIAWSKLDKFC